jgi:hypothetical protein
MVINNQAHDISDIYNVLLRYNNNKDGDIHVYIRVLNNLKIAHAELNMKWSSLIIDNICNQSHRKKKLKRQKIVQMLCSNRSVFGKQHHEYMHDRWL